MVCGASLQHLALEHRDAAAVRAVAVLTLVGQTERVLLIKAVPIAANLRSR